jgi:uncharacterized protein
MIELEVEPSIASIGRETWRSVLGAEAPPFLSYEFLDALEQTGCVGSGRSFRPLHLVLREGGAVVAVAPAYVKYDSDGEFVFDHAIAEFSERRLGIRYYPKLVLASPFTPATGTKLFVREGTEPEAARAALVGGVKRLCESLELSSAHVLFPPEAEALGLAELGLSHRLGIQYHFRNAGYGCFDDFLARYPARRRKQVRREVRALADQAIAIEVKTGVDLTPELADFAYRTYVATVNKYYWGRQYLNRTFFRRLFEALPESVLLVVARDSSSERTIAAALNLIGPRALYGRYWGALEERPFLHFNVCYYRGIEECIARGLEVFEPGAGGEHKRARGFEPTTTHSVHWFREPRVRDAATHAFERERVAIEHYLADYADRPIFKIED